MTNSPWNFANLIRASGRITPSHDPILMHGDRIITRAEMDARTNALARAFLAKGLKAGDKVAHYMRNKPAYLESFIACAKARLVHVNVNYRYQGDELRYILDNSDSMAVVHDTEFAPVLQSINTRLAVIDDIDTAIAGFDTAPLDTAPDGDDLILVYTGGTTGLPKGVMWRHEDLWNALGGGVIRGGQTRPKTIDDHLETLKRDGIYGRLLVTAPFMHGAGLMTALNALANGGGVITLPSPHLDAEALLCHAKRHEATALLIIGDAFARPILRALDNGVGDISNLRLILSSGAMWSMETKQAFLRHNPDLTLFDTYGSSEGLGLGASTTSKKMNGRTASFRLGGKTKLLTSDFQEVQPGSGEHGLIARAGAIPLGYYKDPEKTARTFPVIDGVRYSIPGDWGIADADGTLHLLGRGNQCINTGGEKVFPEEVEEALKTHEHVEDALVFGVPNLNWGQVVSAVVSLNTPVDEATLIHHVKDRLAHYKAPKRIHSVDTVPRQPNGKADYSAAKALFEEKGQGSEYEC